MDSSGIPTLASTVAAPEAQNPDPCWSFGLVTVATSLLDGGHRSAAFVCCVFMQKKKKKKKLLYTKIYVKDKLGILGVWTHTQTHSSALWVTCCFSGPWHLPPPSSLTEWFAPLNCESKAGNGARTTSKQNKMVCVLWGKDLEASNSNFISITILACQVSNYKSMEWKSSCSPSVSPPFLNKAAGRDATIASSNQVSSKVCHRRGAAFPEAFLSLSWLN